MNTSHAPSTPGAPASAQDSATHQDCDNALSIYFAILPALGTVQADVGYVKGRITGLDYVERQLNRIEDHFRRLEERLSEMNRRIATTEAKQLR